MSNHDTDLGLLHQTDEHRRKAILDGVRAKRQHHWSCRGACGTNSFRALQKGLCRGRRQGSWHRRRVKSVSLDDYLVVAIVKRKDPQTRAVKLGVRHRLLLRAQPSNCGAHWKLANALDESGESPTVALQEVSTALTQCPSLAQAYAERARLLLRLHKPAEALIDLQAAERAAPREPSVQSLLAQTYRVLGDRVHADAANQRFVQLEKEQHDAQERHAARLDAK